MNLNLLKNALVGAITQVFNAAPQLELAASNGAMPNPDTQTNDQTRAIATRVLLDQVYALLSEMNAAAYKIDEYGSVYIEWSEYLSCLDVFYDNGDLFAVVTQGGKLYRIPVTVTDDVATLGAMVEIPLTATRSQSRMWVTRDAKTGKRRWACIAGSAVLNRSNELDSTRLFDAFIKRANETKKFPVLSFYHMPDVMRFGVADFLAREEYLYLATGFFYDDPVSQAVADGLERAVETEAVWGNSIGFTSFGDPELLDVGNGITIPMYVDGENTEISIVLEQDAAALFTRMSTEEVTRMNLAVKNKFAELTTPELAEALDAAADTANRTITEEGLVARAAATTAVAPTAEAPTAAAATETATREAVPATAQTFEIPEEMFGALAEALIASPTFQEMVTGINTMQQDLSQLGPRLATLEGGLVEARTATETRLAALEQDETQRTQEILDDLPARRTIVSVRPREVRNAQMDPSGNVVQPDSTLVANSTLDKLNAKRAQQAHA